MATTAATTARYPLPLQEDPVLRPNVRNRVGVGHALIDDCSFEQACEAIVAHVRSGGRPSFVTTANAQHIVLLETDRRLREIYDHADLIVPDGYSLLLAARFSGRSLRERVTGVDMFQSLCGLAAKHGLSVFLLGGRPNAANLAADSLKQRWPALHVTTYCPPVGFEKSEKGLADTERAIRAAKPHMLFVALGAPKQEYWIHDHGMHLSVPVLMGVGGTFEMVAGIVRRAPMWMQRTGLEWLYRLCREPRRMWRRYLIGNLVFGAIVVRQRARRMLVEKFLRYVRDERFAAELREPEIIRGLKRFASREADDAESADVLAR
jgi:N-acetylglucosaminyldiphosphoundecaprenol N-acetyl-beta-D-mannosaminyltransferase